MLGVDALVARQVAAEVASVLASGAELRGTLLHPAPGRNVHRPRVHAHGHDVHLRGPKGVRKGGQRGSEGIYWSSLDAHKPQNPTKTEEYQRHLQGALYST
eukprot:1164981-Prorocentrum_minimum.AAC.1